MSQADDLFNFYTSDPSNVVDSDPIELSLAGQQITNVDFLVPHKDSLLVFTTAGQQFEIDSGQDALSAKTAQIRPATRYETQSIRPQPIGNRIYMLGLHNHYTLLYEYFWDEDNVSHNAANLTKHVFDLLPAESKSITTSPVENVVAITTSDTRTDTALSFTSAATGNWNDDATWEGSGIPLSHDTVTIDPVAGHTVTFDQYPTQAITVPGTLPASNVYLYRSYDKGKERVQSAWTRWTFGSGATADYIQDTTIIDNDMYILRRDDRQGEDQGFTRLIVDKVSLTDERNLASTYLYPFEVHLDHLVKCKGINKGDQGGGAYQIKFDYRGPVSDSEPAGHDYDDSNMDAMVLSNDFSGTPPTNPQTSATAAPGEVITSGGNFNDDGCTISGLTSAEADKWANKEVIIGRRYQFRVQLTKLFQRLENGQAVLDGKTLLERIRADHTESGTYDIKVTSSPGATGVSRTKTFTPDSGFTESFGTTDHWIHGDTMTTDVYFEGLGPEPVTISGFEIQGHHATLGD